MINKKKKMENKALASLEIAIVFCLLFLVALPCIAVASEDETLDIYGNANEDDIIDMRDLTFTARMILRLEDETELADANYDGRISVADMTQIGLIILGRESKLTLVDSVDRIVTVNKPVERIVTHLHIIPEAIKIVGAEDRVVGRQAGIDEILFPTMSKLPVTSGITSSMGWDIYYEEVFELDPDIFITAYHPAPGFEDVVVATLEPDIPVVCLNFGDPATMVEDIRKLRYVLNTEEKGEEFIAFYEGVVNDITEKTAGLSEDDKPRVFMKTPGWTPEQLCTYNNEMPIAIYLFPITGAINVAGDWPGPPGGWIPDVDPEMVIDANPDTVVAQIWPVFYPSPFGYGIDDASVAKETRDQIMAMDAFAGGDAVLNDRVYLYHCDFMTTPRCVVGIAYWAKWFHPTLFSDLDPQDIHQQYLSDFLDIDYDLDEHGVFVYPEP
ncbi:iron complex transport system substrate-binding protein [Methanophagales archaeon]|nr:iron complex transport system substrate-binding protein [Methanophagales archaeon]